MKRTAPMTGAVFKLLDKLECIEQLKLKFITFIKVLLILFNILPITVI